MIRAVLDTNVLVSGIVSRNTGAASVQVVNAWRQGSFELVLSDSILDEVRRTFEKPYFKARLSDKQSDHVVQLLIRYAFLTLLSVEVRGVATHPEDDLILAAALSSGADCLVTGDTQLLKLARFGPILILSPSEFVALLEAAQA